MSVVTWARVVGTTPGHTARRVAKPRAMLAIVGLAVLAAGAAGFAQGGRGRRPPLQVDVEGNTPYDGRFVFVRLRYDGGGVRAPADPPGRTTIRTARCISRRSSTS